MNLKKSYCLLLVLLLTPLVLVGVVQSVSPPSIYINVSSYGINVIGNGWTANADVTLYYDVEDAAHMVATVKANYAGNFQTYIPTNYVATVGTHTVIAVQGADKATTVYDVGVVSPPDDRLLNPILSIQTKLDDVDLEVKAIEAKLDAGGSFYNFVDTWFSTINDTITEINETIVEKVDYEALEIEIHTVQNDTIIDSPYVGFTMYDTQIGGADNQSCVYAFVKFRGQVVDINTIGSWVKDGGKYSWSFHFYPIEVATGVYKIHHEAGPGVAVGSYLVTVYFDYNYAGVTYFGTASYVIECTSTTT